MPITATGSEIMGSGCWGWSAAPARMTRTVTWIVKIDDGSSIGDFFANDTRYSVS